MTRLEGSNRRRPGSDRSSGTTVEVRGLTRRYGHGDGAVQALRGVSVSFPAGSFTAVMGPSGSGKSTLLHCAAGLDRPTRGQVRWDDVDISGLPERRLALLRRQRCGFVFQSFNLLPAMTVAQNVTLPLRLAGARPSHALVDRVLSSVGLAGRAGCRPGELSGDSSSGWRSPVRS